MYVIIIFLTKFGIFTINEILISSKTLLWLCLSSTYENACMYPALLARVRDCVCLCIFNIMTSFQERFKAAWKGACTLVKISLKIIKQREGFSFCFPIVAKFAKTAHRAKRTST